MVHIYTDPMRFSGYKAKIRKTGEEVSSPNTLNNKLKKIHGLKEELSLQDIAQRRKEATSTKTKDVFNRMRSKTPPGLINLDKRPTDNE